LHRRVLNGRLRQLGNLLLNKHEAPRSPRSTSMFGAPFSASITDGKSSAMAMAANISLSAPSRARETRTARCHGAASVFPQLPAWGVGPPPAHFEQAGVLGSFELPRRVLDRSEKLDHSEKRVLSLA
jgi:hypothetical protein